MVMGESMCSSPEPRGAARSIATLVNGSSRTSPAARVSVLATGTRRAPRLPTSMETAILIGIAAVVLTVGLGQGAQQEVSKQLSALGGNLLIISPGSSTTGGVRGGFGSASTLTMADVDGSGRLALYVANYKSYSLEDSIPPQQRAFSRIVRQEGQGPNRYEIAPEFRREYKLVSRPDMGGLRLTARGSPNEFYLNDGRGHFSRVPLTSSRFCDAFGHPLAEEPESFTLDAKFADLNGDGAPDLYVTNDFEDVDELWFNDGHGHFRLADWTAQRQLSNAAMGMDIGDVNGDGLPDVFVVDMLSNDSRRLKTQTPTQTALPKRPGDYETVLQQQRNTLFLNRGDGTFAEVGAYAGVQASGWSWGTMLMDVDLDGWLDILIANGHLWDLMDADVHERLDNPLTNVEWQRVRWAFPRLPLRNVALRNRGDWTFEDVSTRWRFGNEEDISHALAAADLDGDGDLDVVVNRLGAPALVLRNDAPAPRVAVRLIGDAPNTRAIGAKVRLLGGAVPVQEREISVGGLYLSHSDYLASFAMGRSLSATLVVDWRDGRTTVIGGVRPNREYEITAATAAARADTGVTDAGEPPALFEDASDQLAGHTHVEPMFDDWARQFLLPNSLSQLGPGVSWVDLDADGDEDLLIGSGRGGRLGVFRNEHGRLVRKPAEGPVAPADLTTILGFPAKDGPELLLGVSSWEGQEVSAVMRVRTSSGVVGPTAEPFVEGQSAATGPLALADYDGDGDLDRFQVAIRRPPRRCCCITSGDGSCWTPRIPLCSTTWDWCHRQYSPTSTVTDTQTSCSHVSGTRCCFCSMMVMGSSVSLPPPGDSRAGPVAGMASPRVI